MKLQQPLTKRNFFNEMQHKYPNAMKHFCAWIDAYKKEVSWEMLFANTSNVIGVKFHDIPYEMQLGIWLEYVNQQGGCYYEIDIFEFDLRRDMEEYFKERN